MPKLKRYTTYEALKSDAKSGKASSYNNKKYLSELEKFVTLLRNELPVKKEAKNR